MASVRIIIGGLLFALGTCAACDGAQTRMPTTSDGGAGIGGAGGSAPASGGGGAGPCEPAPLPDGVPEGWVEYTDWSCGCRFYFPGPTARAVPPIRWEGCPPGANAVPGCEAMKTDWTDHHIPITPFNHLDVREDGTPVLQFRRNVLDAPVPHFKYMVADADGPVHVAMQMLYEVDEFTAEPSCVVFQEGLREGRYFWQVAGHKAFGNYSESPHKGLLAANVADFAPPSVVIHHVDDVQAYSFRGNARWLLQVPMGFYTTARSWDLTEEHVVTAPSLDPEGLHLSQPQLVGEAIFFTTSNSKRRGVNVWTPTSGALPLVRWIGDATRGAADLGTDGVDLVWNQGEGKAPSETKYPIRDIMTAPYTTHPDALAPRRLRSQPRNSFGVYAFAVGCGRALYPLGNGTLLLVRIADGASWTIGPDEHTEFLEHIGLSCEHLYGLAQVDGVLTIARVRLDALGEPMPPD